MPKLIKWREGVAALAEDPFVDLADDAPTPEGAVLASWARFEAEGEAFLASGRLVGVRLAADEGPERLAPWMNRLALIALTFPKFRDGRALSAARILRERMGWRGELRAVGDVLIDLAPSLIRCGFDAVAPADSSAPEDWTRAAGRFAHVYQRAADARKPAFALREVSHAL